MKVSLKTLKNVVLYTCPKTILIMNQFIVFLKFQNSKKSVVAQTQQSTSRPSWKSSSTEQKDLFKSSLSEKLNNIIVPDCVNSCQNVHCKNIDHINDIDDYLFDILDSIDDQAIKSLKSSGGNKTSKKNKAIPLWNQVVKPFKESANFWHSVWVSCDRPINTEVHKIMKRTRNLYHFHVRKCKKAEKNVKASKLLEACLNDGNNLFKEIKKQRKTKPKPVNQIDDKNENISDQFGNIYKNLFNSVDDDQDLSLIKTEIDNKINISATHDVKKVFPEVVKSAIGNLNPGKTDPVFKFSSDCLINGPDNLNEHLSNVIQAFLIHNHVSMILLLSTLVPLIKDKLGDKFSSKNYRSIAISSLILKIFDWITLILFGSCLGLDTLQYSYQAGTSTTMCTWTAIETISYFLRNGSNVYSCIMDMTKAFDLVKHSKLFRKLLDCGLSVIFTRLLLTMYLLQKANVRWNGELSDAFNLSNGVKQGAVLSAILYCFYVNDLFKILRKKKSGCSIQGYFLGILGYADDNLLLAPSKEALQEMLNTCDSFAKDHNLQFSTDPKPQKSKTKCLIFSTKQINEYPEKLTLGENKLPWVENGKHLGNIFENILNGRKKDNLVKRARYIQKNNEIQQEFYFCHPDVQFKINRIYNSHFTGSSLWDLFSKEATMVENTWNVSFRLMYNLPRSTHRYFVEPISGIPHIKKTLVKNFLSFIDQIKKSNKTVSKVLLETLKYDTNCTTGSNLRNIMKLVNKRNIDELNTTDYTEIEYHKIPADEEWRIGVVRDIIDIRNGEASLEGFSLKDLENMLDFIGTN